LKKEIESAMNGGDEITSKYLLLAQEYLSNPEHSNIEYVGGGSIPPVQDAIMTLAYNGTHSFSNSVASCVRNRIEDEIAAIRQEYKYCKLVLAKPELFEQCMYIIRRAKTELEAINKLQLELSLSRGEAEFLQNLPLGTLCDSRLITDKVKAIRFLLAYLKYLKTLIKSEQCLK